MSIVAEPSEGWVSLERKMGHAALAQERSCIKNRPRSPPLLMVDVLQNIQAMLSAKTGDLDSIERTLTDGYAHALSLEAEKWRLERRLTEVAQGIEGGDTKAKARELSSLAERLDGNQGELETLRGVLADLRRHADGLRVAS
jgi:hypothetical protein